MGGHQRTRPAPVGSARRGSQDVSAPTIPSRTLVRARVLMGRVDANARACLDSVPAGQTLPAALERRWIRSAALYSGYLAGIAEALGLEFPYVQAAVESGKDRS